MFGLAVLWRFALHQFGNPVGLLSTPAWYFAGKVGKYLPGGVWPVLGRGELAWRYGRIDRSVGYATTLISYAAMTAGAALVCGVLGSMVATDASGTAWAWALVGLLPAVAIGAHPVFLRRPLAPAARLTRGRLTLQPISWRAMSLLIGSSVPTWLLVGVTSVLGRPMERLASRDAMVRSLELSGQTRLRRTAGGVTSSIRRRWAEALPLIAAHRSEWPLALVRLRQGGLALIGVQFLAFCVWSAVLVHRFALTHDFVTYEQAVYLISHGHLNPFSTNIGYPFWQDHGAFLVWPLAFLDWLWPHPVTLLWLQDLLTVGAVAVAFVWICDLASIQAQRLADQRLLWACVCVALILLVINPWIMWTISTDFHVEPLAMVWIVAAARDLFADRRRTWIWLVLALSSGDVGASCCGALGISAMIAGRRWWRTGLAVACAGFGWMLVLGALHATRGTVPSYYAQLILGHPGRVSARTSSIAVIRAVITHPWRAVRALWSNGLNIWADLSIAGVLGLVWPQVTVPIVLVLVESALTYGPRFSAPGVQNLLVYILGAIGTVAICLKLAGRPGTRRLLPVLLLAVAANAIGWAAVWFPRLSGEFLTVTPQAAATLRQLSQRIGPGDQVVVQQGISSGFARRRFIHPIFQLPSTFAVRSHRVWMIFAPTQGVEEAAPSDIYAAITQLSAMPDVRLDVAANGIWAFEWTPPSGARQLTLASPSPPKIGAWTLTGPAGEAVRRGPARDWHVISNGQSGYVVAGDYWREPTGQVSARVALAAAATTNVELWDDTTNTLLERKTLSDTHGPVIVRLGGEVRAAHVGGAYAGWGPWRISPKQPPAGHVLEVRVWSSGARGKVTVRWLSLTPGQ